MKGRATIQTDGTIITEWLPDEDELEPLTVEEIKKLLRRPEIGQDTMASMLAVQRLVVLLRHAQTQPELRLALELVQVGAELACFVQLVSGFGESDLTAVVRDLRAAIATLLGTAVAGKNGVSVPDSAITNRVALLLDRNAPKFKRARSGAQSAIVEAVVRRITDLAGRAPEESAVRAALGSRSQGRPKKGTEALPKLQAYQSLLANVGLQTASAEALGQARTRAKRRARK